MLKTVRNVLFVLGAIFSWGIVGSIELERLALSEGVIYIAAALAVCALAALFELAFRAAKVLLTVYALRRKKAVHTALRRDNYARGRISV